MIVQNSPIYLPYKDLKKYRQILRDYGYKFNSNSYYQGTPNEYFYYDNRLYAEIEHRREGFLLNIVPLFMNKKKCLEIPKYKETTACNGFIIVGHHFYCDFVENEKDCRKKIENQLALIKKRIEYRTLEQIKKDF